MTPLPRKHITEYRIHLVLSPKFGFHAGGLLRLPLFAVTSCLKSVRADMKPVTHAYLRAKIRCDDSLKLESLQLNLWYLGLVWVIVTMLRIPPQRPH